MSEVKNQTEGKEVTTVTDDEIAGLVAQNSKWQEKWWNDAEKYVNSEGFGSDYNNIDSNEANKEIRQAYLDGLAEGRKEELIRNVCSF